MATRKTEATELSLAFGILEIDPWDIDPSEIPLLFEGTISPEKFTAYLAERNGLNNKLYDTLFALGSRIRHSYPHFGVAHSLRWLGPEKQSLSVSSAQDLLVCGIPVSIKANSNVVYNRSPRNLFERVPSGMRPLPRSDNWFFSNNPKDLQLLYQIAANNIGDHDLPLEYTEFERVASPKDRKRLQTQIDSGVPAFRQTYESMCHSVSKSSADLFNDIFARTFASAERIPMLDGLLEVFFRLDSVSYILTGIDGGIPFALSVPSITDWRRHWQVINVLGVPDSTSGQCVVVFEFTVEHRQTRKAYVLPFHVEVRWSHGKFCGNPEAKLYKNFLWTDAPFFISII